MDYFTKTNKTTRVLILYNQLLNGQYIDSVSFSLEHGISERTFDRDIEDIRMFLSEVFSGNELVFDKATGLYYLTGCKLKYMDRMDAAVIGEILLSSNALRRDEVNGLFQDLLAVVSPNDAKVIASYLHQSIMQYDAKTESALMKTLGDFYVAICHGNDIEITLKECDSGFVLKKVAPLKVEIQDSVFYLVGAEDLNINSIVRYRLDSIDSFKVLHTSYAKAFKTNLINSQNI